MLSGMSGSSHQVLTAVTLVCDGVVSPLSFCEATQVRTVPLLSRAPVLELTRVCHRC